MIKTLPQEMTLELAKTSVYMEREFLINSVSWRYERYARNERMRLPQQDNINDLDAYVQQLADITKQHGFPYSVDYPDYPKSKAISP